MAQKNIFDFFFFGVFWFSFFVIDHSNENSDAWAHNLFGERVYNLQSKDDKHD